MARHIWIGFTWIAAAACLAALAGCGGDGGPNLTAEVADLEDALADTQAQLEQTQEDLDTAEAARLAAQEEAARVAAEQAEAARLAAEQAEADETPATTPTTTTPAPTLADAAVEPEVSPRPELVTTPTTPTPTGPATTTPTPSTPPAPAPPPAPTQTAEATQRADYFNTVLVGTETPPEPPVTDTSPVSITVPTRGSLRLMRSGYTTQTLGGSGIRSATLPLIGTGDEGKTVVYTDRELSRLLLDHYDNSRDTTDDTRLLFTGTVTGVTTLSTDGVIQVTSDMWRISHGVSTSLTQAQVDNLGADFDAGTDAYTPDARSSYGGSLHNQSGSFVCGVDGCEVQVTATYMQGDGPDGIGDNADDTYTLGSVTVASTAANDQVFFDPNSPTSAAISLYTGGPVGADQEYMVFGYWREDPASPAGPYQFEAFSWVPMGETTDTVPTATFDGIAVGGYAEKDPSEVVDVWRQGEFTADVHLEADGTNISGTIDDFVTTPTEGSTAPQTADRWVVTLGNTTPGTDGVTSINLGGGAGAGAWTATLVAPHARSTDTDATAVTGTFDVHIENAVTIVGAYGATRR